MLSEVVQRSGIAVFKVGIAILVSSLANQHLRNKTDETLKSITQDVRKLKTQYRDSKLQLDGDPS